MVKIVKVVFKDLNLPLVNPKYLYCQTDSKIWIGSNLLTSPMDFYLGEILVIYFNCSYVYLNNSIYYVYNNY